MSPRTPGKNPPGAGSEPELEEPKLSKPSRERMHQVESPPTAPAFDADVYLVLDDFGTIGRAYRETDERQTDRETVIQNFLSVEYNNPVRVVCFNTAQGSSRDATLEIVREIQERASRQGLELSRGLRDFIDYEIARETRREAANHSSSSSIRAD